MAGSTRAWEALGFLLLMAWFMAMAQLRSDSLTPVYDTGFAILPVFTAVIWENSSGFTNLSDVFVVASVLIFFLLVLPFCVKRPWLTFVRFLWCVGYLFALRTLSLLATTYPLTPDANDRYLTPNVALGAVLILFGVRTTASDYMFSGHTVLFTISAVLFWQYRKRGHEYTALSLLYWALSIAGMILLVGVRLHYTSDVLISLFLSVLVATLYYVVANPERRDSWVQVAIKWCES